MRISETKGQLLIGTSTTSGFDKAIVMNSPSSTSGLLFQLNGVDKGFVYSGGGDLFMGSNSNTIQLYTNGVERIRVLANGTTSFGGDLFTYQNGGIFFNTAGNYASGIYSRDAGVNLILQAGGAERMRVVSNGDILFGKSALNWQANGTQIENLGRSLGVTSNVNAENIFLHKINQTGNFIFFLYNSNGVGTISTNGSSTSFNTTSDYRLKTDFKPLNGLSKIKDINVYDFQWKSTGERMDGMIAHELQDILPYAVSGVKDGKDMQMVDYSKIVPVLVQAIKELNAKLEAK